MPTNKTNKEPIAKYQGSGDWGPKYGLIHYFTILKEFNKPHKLVVGTSVTDKIVKELGGEFDLTKLKKDDLIYSK